MHVISKVQKCYWKYADRISYHTSLFSIIAIVPLHICACKRLCCAIIYRAAIYARMRQTCFWKYIRPHKFAMQVYMFWFVFCFCPLPLPLRCIDASMITHISPRVM